MVELVLEKVLSGVAKLALWISFGVLLGVALEVIGLVRRLGAISRPLVRLLRLPPIAASAFVTSFVSPKSGNAMLSGAFANEEISRRSLVLSAAANSFPSTLMHLKVSGPLLIAMLGAIGMAYVAFVTAGGCAVLATVILISRLWRGDAETAEREVTSSTPGPGLAGAWKRAWSRWRKLLPKVLLVSLPLYAAIAWLNDAGLFRRWSRMLPGGLEDLLPPESMVILASHMAGATRAATVAREFLESEALSPLAVLLTLMTGYALTLPVRVLRRTLPSTLSLFPGGNGFLIIAVTQIPRMIFAVCLITVWMLLN